MILRKTLLTIFTFSLFTAAKAQSTNIQFINNCPDDSLIGINVYVDGNLALSGLNFRQCSSFITVPALQPVTISVSDMSKTIEDTFYSVTTTFSNNPIIKYIAVGNGVISNTGYSPLKKFSLSFFNLAKDISGITGNTDVVFVNGCTDATGTYDFRSGAKILADNVVYGQFSANYAEMPTANYPIRMTNADGSQVLKTFLTIFDGHHLFHDKPAAIVMSGFMNPAANSNGPAFGLWAAPTTGGPLYELDTTVPEAIARMQIGHNAGDTALDTLDIYIDNELRYDDFLYRHATPFIDFVANVTTNIGIAKRSSSSVADTFYNLNAILDSSKKYLAIANGVKSSGYIPNEPFVLMVYPKNAREAASPGNTDIMPFNGATDLQEPNLKITEGSNTIGTGLFYGNYPGYTSVTASDAVYVLRKSNGDTIQMYDAQMQTLGLGGLAVTLVTSGFYDTAKNKLSPVFGLYWIKPSGGPFIRLPIHVKTDNIENTAGIDLFTIWPNPASEYIYLSGNIDFGKANGIIYDVSGRTVKVLTDISGKKIDIHELNKGIYFLKLNINNQYYQKFIKE